MTSPLPIAELFGIEWLWWWQIPLFLLLIGIIIAYVIYRRRQL